MQSQNADLITSDVFSNDDAVTSRYRDTPRRLVTVPLLLELSEARDRGRVVPTADVVLHPVAFRLLYAKWWPWRVSAQNMAPCSFRRLSLCRPESTDGLGWVRPMHVSVLHTAIRQWHQEPHACIF